MTYTIPRYPVHLIDIVPAANGRRVTIRPMLPQDFELQREFFHSLSPMARYARFMAAFSELPDAVAQRLSKIDYSSHLALLAEIFEGRQETMIGEARYVIEERDPRAANSPSLSPMIGRAVESAMSCSHGWNARRRLRVSGACSPIRSTTTRRCACSPYATATRSRLTTKTPGSSD